MVPRPVALNGEPTPERNRTGVVPDDGTLKITAIELDHVPVEPAYAYRFDTKERSVVLSGDTAPSDALVRLARGADVLVHEVLIVDGDEMPRLLDLAPDHPLVQHIVRSHTSFRDVGKVARDAGVKTLVLSHFVPGDRPVDREAILQEIRKAYAGEVVFGEDLMRVP